MPRESRRACATTRTARALFLDHLAASTAVAVSQWYHSAVVKPRVTEHEYARAQHWLTLPPGASWPEFKIEPNTVTGKGGGASRAVTVSKEAWECYWVAAIRRQDEEAERRAQTELERLLADNVVVAPTGAPEDWAPSPAPRCRMPSGQTTAGSSSPKRCTQKRRRVDRRCSPKAAGQTAEARLGFVSVDDI